MTEPFLVLDRVAGETSGTAAKFFEIGFHHIGVEVGDVDAVVERARRRGVRILREPALSDAFDFGLAARPGSPPVVKSATLADADGNIVQIDHWIGASVK